MHCDILAERYVDVRKRNFSHKLNDLHAKIDRVKFIRFFHFTSGHRTLIVTQPSFLVGDVRMAHTIFILGTDPQQCKELREILQGRIADDIVTPNRRRPSQHQRIRHRHYHFRGKEHRHPLPAALEQTRRTGPPRRTAQPAHPACFPRRCAIDELLDRVVTKSTEVLGDTSFVVLSSEAGNSNWKQHSPRTGPPRENAHDDGQHGRAGPE